MGEGEFLRLYIIQYLASDQIRGGDVGVPEKLASELSSQRVKLAKAGAERAWAALQKAGLVNQFDNFDMHAHGH